MRRMALVPLLAATGCNWVFGLEPTVVIDASGAELPPGPRTRLVWAIATTDGMPTPGIDPVLEYRAIGSESLHPTPPTVEVGDDTGLTAADYDLADGSFEIPYRLRESPHRIVYTLPGETVPHEVQWSVTGAVLVVPRTTRADAPTPPANSGYALDPEGLQGTPSSPVAYTSGVFTATDGDDAFDRSGNVMTFKYSERAKPLAGPRGAPQGSKGDWLLLTQWASQGTYTSVNGWAIARNLELVADAISTPVMQPSWNITPRTLSQLDCPGPDCLPSSAIGGVTQRLDNILGSLGGTETIRFAYGASPSTELPGFVLGAAPSYLERPLILSFADATQIVGTITLRDPMSELGLKPVVFARCARTRTVGGVQLTSAIQAITDVFSGSIQYGAPLATNPKLAGISLGVEQGDGVTVPASTTPLRLTFETEAGFSADDFVITLYEITGTSLMPVRIFHVIKPEVKIDGSLLVSGHSYVFGITARTGLGSADRGDYQKAQFPFGSTTTFPRTFVVQ